MSVSIRIKNAVKRYGDNTIIPNLSLDVNDGEFFTLLGSSGCGKTTLLRMIAGFNSIEGGEFYFNDKLINDLPPEKRNIGMVFQNYAVFPHMTAYQNVAFGLEERKIRDPEKKKRVEDILSLVQISELRDRKPENMSGGQQQRIALARAIVIKPDVLLMDEPLSNLDAKLRIEMRSVIRRIQKQFGITTIYVTHDQSEALAISDRIAIMNHGVIQQIGTPFEVYRRPENIFSATFIGESSLLDGIVAGEKTIDINGYHFSVPELIDGIEKGTHVVVCIRPDDFIFSDSGLAGKVLECTYLGKDFEYLIKLSCGKEIKADMKAVGSMVKENTDVSIAFDAAMVNVFDAESGESLMRAVYESKKSQS